MKKIDSKERLIVFNESGSSIRGILSLSPEQLKDIGVYNGSKSERTLHMIRYDNFIVLAPSSKEPTEKELAQIQNDLNPFKKSLIKLCKELIINLNSLLKHLNKS